MKLLMVSPSLPSPTWGAGTRNYHLLKTLARQHTVSLLALVDSAEIKERDLSLLQEFAHPAQVVARPAPLSKRLQQLMCILRGRPYALEINSSTEVQKALDRSMLNHHYDAVLYESALIAGYRLPEGVKCIVDQHNIEYELRWRTYQRESARLRKWFNWLESRLLKPVELRRCLRADVVLVTSERERLALERALPGKALEVVPNGVDIEYFHGNHAEQAIPGRIVFTGAMDYYPNVDAVLFFARQCWPIVRDHLPNATWQIVGRNPLPEVWKLAELPGVTVTGSVPDTRPYLAEAEVAIVPLLIAGGTRLKILEALAMRKAVVSTSIGCEGLAVVAGEHLIVEDQPQKFALALIKLLGSPETRTALGAAGRRLVEAEYSWERCGNRLLHALDMLNAERKTPC